VRTFDARARVALRRRYRRRRTVAVLLIVALVFLIAWIIHRRPVTNAANHSPMDALRTRIVTIAEGQVGYETDPVHSYCNKFSAYWGTGTPCGNDNTSEEWCSDFATWVWKRAGALVNYLDQPGDLNQASASFYLWGVDHGTWHAAGSGYRPQPGDVAVYGLNRSTLVAQHVAIVIDDPTDAQGPDVVNGDGSRTGFSVVEIGHDQIFADVHGHGGRVSGYVSPSLSN
jgi:CHAP domain